MRDPSLLLDERKGIGRAEIRYGFYCETWRNGEIVVWDTSMEYICICAVLQRTGYLSTLLMVGVLV